jgi:hypothetical protein
MQQANIMAGECCIAYLSFSGFETQVTKYTKSAIMDMIALAKIASATRGGMLAPDYPGQRILHVLDKFRNF